MSGTARYHAQLAQFMTARCGDKVRADLIKRLVSRAYPEPDIRFVQASDHCTNCTNRDPRVCAMTPDAIFRRTAYATCEQ